MNQNNTNPPLKKRFLVEDMFNKFLTNLGMDKRKMKPSQIRDSRRAFFGAIGMFMMTQSDELSKDKYTDVEVGEILQDILNQVSEYFEKDQN